MKSEVEGRSLSEARFEDAILRAEKGSVAMLGFFTPGERRAVERFLRMRSMERACFWGGYAAAERTLLLLPPPYLEDFFPRWWDSLETFPSEELLFEELHSAVRAVRVTGSGYRTLTHRDYLGSLLGLGIERDVLGDIAVQNSGEAVVFCIPRLVPFLCENLTKVANDTVRCTPYTPDATFTDGRIYQPLQTTVASMRLDGIVAALTGRSREVAQRSIEAGTVELDYEVCMRVDRLLTVPATLSVRGVGKFILRSVDGETRKGRLRLRADRLV